MHIPIFALRGSLLDDLILFLFFFSLFPAGGGSEVEGSKNENVEMFAYRCT